MSMITPALIKAINPRHPRPEVAAQKIQAATLRYGIITPRQVAMFLAQVGHESGLIPQEENLNYRATRIAQVWPSRFPTIGSAIPFEFNPKALGDKVYDNRMGNGKGEGFLFRGRGPIQLTGKVNYMQYERRTGFKIVSNPDFLLQYGVGFDVSCAYFVDHGCNQMAERGDIRGVTYAINGGLIGLDDRERLYQRALNRVPRYGLLGADAPLDVALDAANDLDMRYESLNRISSLLMS